MLAFGFLTIISVITAYDTATAQIYGIEYGKIILMSVMAIILIQHVGQIRMIATMILLMLGYIAWEINSLYLIDGRLDIFHHGYGTLDNNGAGLMLGRVVPAYGLDASVWVGESKSSLRMRWFTSLATARWPTGLRWVSIETW